MFFVLLTIEDVQEIFLFSIPLPFSPLFSKHREKILWPSVCPVLSHPPISASARDGACSFLGPGKLLSQTVSISPTQLATSPPLEESVTHAPPPLSFFSTSKTHACCLEVVFMLHFLLSFLRRVDFLPVPVFFMLL